MQAHVSPQTVADMVNRMTPERRAHLNNNLKLPTLALERWLKKPTEADILTTEQIEALSNWVLGKYAHVSSKEGYILMEERVAPVQQLPKGQRAKTIGKTFTHPADGPNVPLGMKVVRQALRGDKLPTPDEAALAKAKVAEKKERSKARNPMKRMAQAVQPLWGPNQVRPGT